ncbi:hypothetical protein J6590_080777 [Homalodisca vitripennis]|nr:hypothetical protein J6590_080777 [Homalodisca vitripennis]
MTWIITGELGEVLTGVAGERGKSSQNTGSAPSVLPVSAMVSTGLVPVLVCLCVFWSLSEAQERLDLYDGGVARKYHVHGPSERRHNKLRRHLERSELEVAMAPQTPILSTGGVRKEFADSLSRALIPFCLPSAEFVDIAGLKKFPLGLSRASNPALEQASLEIMEVNQEVCHMKVISPFYPANLR